MSAHSCIGPGCDSQHLRGGSQWSVTSGPGDLMPFFWPLWVPGMKTVHRYMFMQNTHTHKAQQTNRPAYIVWKCGSCFRRLSGFLRCWGWYESMSYNGSWRNKCDSNIIFLCLNDAFQNKIPFTQQTASQWKLTTVSVKVEITLVRVFISSLWWDLHVVIDTHWTALSH